jgi:hypothetical protein
MESQRIRLGEIRYIRLTEDFVIIEDDFTKKHALLSLQRWSKLIDSISEIDVAVGTVSVEKEGESAVDMRKDIGGNWYVSVTSKVFCVDIRKFYKAKDSMKPSREGIGLRFHEWSRLKSLIEKIHERRPDIAAVTPCYLGEDHQNQEGWCSLVCLFSFYVSFCFHL